MFSNDFTSIRDIANTISKVIEGIQHDAATFNSTYRFAVTTFHMHPLIGASCGLIPIKNPAEALAKDLVDCLKKHRHSIGEEFDIESVASALRILAEQPDQKPLIAMVKILVENRTYTAAAEDIDKNVRRLDLQLKEVIRSQQSLASEAFVEQQAEGVKRYVANRTRERKKGPVPGPRISATRYDDLKRVHDYVQQGYTLNKACEVVDAENKDPSRNEKLPVGEEHYACAGSMRNEYPKWLERERKAGRRTD